MNRDNLKGRTDLTQKDVDKLEELERFLPLIADLAGEDLFICCKEAKTEKIFVVAQAAPRYMPSTYQKSVIGLYAEEWDEPAVHRALNLNLPVRDTKAMTQEGKTVRQDAIPISEENGKTLGVLVGERDISRYLSKEKKYEAMLQRREESVITAVSQEQSTIRELHHRMKNHLQLIASIMNLQARKSDNQNVKEALNENILRILSIASVNELLSKAREGTVSLWSFLKQLTENLSVLQATDKKIILRVNGDDLQVLQTQATDIAVIVNELITNAYKHAFVSKQEGIVDIIIKRGEYYSSIMVKDNGEGYDQNKASESLGMFMVKRTVRDKLKGKIYIQADHAGTTVVFDFLNKK